MAYENYTIREFENALFKGDRTVLSEEEFSIVYDEYVDTAKLYEEEEFNKVSYIQYLNGRINTISLAIKLQKEFINEFEVPYQEGFKVFKDKGFVVYWKGNKEEFLKCLHRIENKNKVYISEVENCIKQLVEFRKSKSNKEEQPVKIRRASWIKTINILGQSFRIDKDKETVEDLAFMIIQQKESNKQ